LPSRSAIALAFSAVVGSAATARADDCVMTISRTAPVEIAGAYIHAVTVRTDAPINLPVAGDWLASLRRTTETAVVQRQLLFHPGDHVDTARVAETLRRLRDQRIYADVSLGVSRCDSTGVVDLTIVTRDAWTLRPIARVVPPTAFSIGVEDRNLLGTARVLSVTANETSRGHGGGVSLTDPFLFGENLVGSARFSDVAGNHVARVGIRHHELSVFDDWRGGVSLSRQTFGDLAEVEHPIASVFLVAELGHRIGSSLTSVTIPYGGVELDSGSVVAVRRGDTVPSVHSRRFMGADIGLMHRAAAFDTVSWFIPSRGFLDTPMGFEEDVLIAPGTDRGQHALAARYDAWAGRMWIPTRGYLVTTDIWASGYLGNVRNNHVDRVAMSGYHESSGGFVGTRLMFEQLLEVDPDLRGVTLATSAADPTFAAVPSIFRAANRAAFVSTERAFHIVPIGRASMLDAGVFAAGSIRWDAPNTITRSFGIATAGLRVRALSTNGLVNSMRFDLSFPVRANTAVSHRPLLSVSLAPLFDVARQRDGRRR
jgi:hypothetical protein